MNRREKLEEAYDAQVHFFNEAEGNLENYFHQFKQRSEFLVELVQSAYKGTDEESTQSLLGELEENLETYTRTFHERSEFLTEVRDQTKREFEALWEA